MPVEHIGAESLRGSVQARDAHSVQVVHEWILGQACSEDPPRRGARAENQIGVQGTAFVPNSFGCGFCSGRRREARTICFAHSGTLHAGSPHADPPMMVPAAVTSRTLLCGEAAPCNELASAKGPPPPPCGVLGQKAFPPVVDLPPSPAARARRRPTSPPPLPSAPPSIFSTSTKIVEAW